MKEELEQDRESGFEIDEFDSDPDYADERYLDYDSEFESDQE